MLRWLLKYEGYPPGFVFAVLLHGAIIAILIGREFQPREIVNLEKPVFIAAAISKDNPQRVKREEQQRRQLQQQQTLERERERQRQQQAEAQRREQAEQERQRQAAAEQQRQEQQRQEQERQAAAERQRQADAEKVRQAEAEKKRQEEAEKQRLAEAEKQRQAEAERQRQAEAERQRRAEQERQAAAAAAAAAEAEAASTNLVSQYAALIAQLVSENWVRSPDTRNGMVAVVEIRMAPTGEILSSNIVQSSGNANYDRSVDQAVKRLGRVPEMQDLPNAVFERNFRVFTLTFTPEDLLR